MRTPTRRSSARYAVAILFASCLVAPSLASAQSWLSDRDRAEGPGIRVGDFELHPGIGAEIGFDSNVFNSSGDPSDPLSSSAILRISPHLFFSTIGPDRLEENEGEEPELPTVRFRGGLSASLYHYFATTTPTNVGTDLDLRLTVLPERPFSFTIHETFSRDIRPFTEAGASDDNYARDRNEAGIKFDFGTRGRVLQGHVGYNFVFDFFEGESFRFANRIEHQVQAGAAWRFFPQTAFLYDFGLNISDYTSTRPRTVQLSESIVLRNRVGLNGAFTNKFSLMAMVGYAAGFFDAGDEFDNLIAQLELRWKFSDDARLAVGYDRDYFPSHVGGFTRRDRGYANFQIMFGGSFLLGLEASAGLYDFGALFAADGITPLGAGGESAREDVRITGSLFAEYRFTDWLGANGTVSYTGDFTDFRYQRDLGGVIFPDPAEYQKFEAWFGVRAFY